MLKLTSTIIITAVICAWLPASVMAKSPSKEVSREVRAKALATIEEFAKEHMTDAFSEYGQIVEKLKKVNKAQNDFTKSTRDKGEKLKKNDTWKQINEKREGLLEQRKGIISEFFVGYCWFRMEAKDAESDIDKFATNFMPNTKVLLDHVRSIKSMDAALRVELQQLRTNLGIDRVPMFERADYKSNEINAAEKDLAKALQEQYFKYQAELTDASELVKKDTEIALKYDKLFADSKNPQSNCKKASPANRVLLRTSNAIKDPSAVVVYSFDGDLINAKNNKIELESSGEELFCEDRFGVLKSAYRLNGNNYLTAKEEFKNAEEVADSFTFSCWFRAECDTTVYQETTGNGTASGNKAKFLIHPSQKGNESGIGIAAGRNCIMVFEHGNKHYPCVLCYETDLGDKWHHLAITVANSGTPELYVDGKKVKTGIDRNRRKYLCVHTNRGIGNAQWGRPFVGAIDELVVFNRALSPTEILNLTAASRSGRVRK